MAKEKLDRGGTNKNRIVPRSKGERSRHNPQSVAQPGSRRTQPGRIVRRRVATVATEFHGIEKLLWGIVWSFHKRHGNYYGTPDELFSEVSIAFVRAFDSWTPARGKLTTFAHWKAYHALKDLQCKKNDQRRLLKEVPLGVINHASKTYGFARFWRDLSVDAQTVVELVLDTPAGLAAIFRQEERSIQSVLWSYLYGAGWTRKRIRRSFDEIRYNIKHA